MTAILPTGAFLFLATLALPAAAQQVAWIEVENASASGSSLTKTCEDCAHGGARSRQQLDSGNAYVEFQVPDAQQLLFLGVSNQSSGTGFEEIDFAIRTQNGLAEVRENNVYRTDVPVGNGDTFRITVQDGKVMYAKNGEVFYTSTATPQYPLFVDASLLSPGARVENVVVSAF